MTKEEFIVFLSKYSNLTSISFNTEKAKDWYAVLYEYELSDALDALKICIENGEMMGTIQAIAIKLKQIKKAREISNKNRELLEQQKRLEYEAINKPFDNIEDKNETAEKVDVKEFLRGAYISPNLVGCKPVWSLLEKFCTQESVLRLKDELSKMTPKKLREIKND